jgi:F-type H+-transporting ATPase subunit a
MFSLKLKSAVVFLAALFVGFNSGSAFAVDASSKVVSAPSANGAAGQGNPVIPEAEHGLSQKAVEIGRPFGFPITNSMVVSWVVAVGLIIFAQMATRQMKQVPEGTQNFLEWLVESLYGFLEGIIGPHLVKRTFWFFATIFIFILSANWLGLIPGVGTVGWGHQTSHGFKMISRCCEVPTPMST